MMLSYVKCAFRTAGGVNYESGHWNDFVIYNHSSFLQLCYELRRDNLVVSSITQEQVEITAENYDTLEYGSRICVLYDNNNIDDTDDDVPLPSID